jgi:hypothetical protein
MSTEKSRDNRVIIGVSILALIGVCLCVFLCVCLLAGIGVALGINELPVYMDPIYY